MRKRYYFASLLGICACTATAAQVLSEGIDEGPSEGWGNPSLLVVLPANDSSNEKLQLEKLEPETVDFHHVFLCDASTEMC